MAHSAQRTAEAIDLAIQGMAVEARGHGTFEETNQWFRFSDAEIAAKGDGLNANTAGVTGLPLLALRTITRPGNWHMWFNRAGYLNAFAKAARSTQALFTLVTPTNTMADWITTGRSYMRARHATGQAADARPRRTHTTTRSLPGAVTSTASSSPSPKRDKANAEPTWIPEPTSRHAEVFRRLVVHGDLRGNRVTDAYLSALAIQHGVGVCSADSDFARFSEVRWVNPMQLKDPTMA